VALPFILKRYVYNFVLNLACNCSIHSAVMKYVDLTPPYRGGNMDLGDVHAVLIDLRAKGKLRAICNAMAPFSSMIMSDKVEHQKSCLPYVTELNFL
jgi:hypothetical protein